MFLHYNTTSYLKVHNIKLLTFLFTIVILVGDMAVGKSSIHSQYVKNEFPESPLPTIAIEFATKIIPVKEGGCVKAQLWDTAGQEKYKSITSHHYRKAVGALLVYDVTRRNTFDNCMKWYSELKNYTEKNCVIALVGNKIDILVENPQKREVNYSEAKELARKNDMMFFETSAKNKDNIKECFEELIQQIYNVKRRNGNDNQLRNSMSLSKSADKVNFNRDEDLGCC